MASFPAEILLGIYLGLLVGVVPALAAWGLGFGTRYALGVTFPGLAVAAGAVGLAALNGLVLAWAGEPVSATPTAPRVVTATLVVGLLATYAHERGADMATEFPRRVATPSPSARTLSPAYAALENDGAEVRVRVVGEVADMEGYPPLSAELRAELRNAEVRLPADLRLDELEERLADRLETEYDLGAVSVTVDERGRATVVAAPPFSGLSKRVDADRHAVTVAGLIPTGLARGDEVTVITPNAQVRGTVISAESGDDRSEAGASDPDPLTPTEADEEDAAGASPVRTPTTTGGEGRLTVAVTRTDVQPLLQAEDTKIVVESRGTRREYEVVSLLRRADRRIRRFAIRAGSVLDGERLGTARLREAHDVTVLAVRKPDGWELAPRGETRLDAGDELFAVGTRETLEEFEGSVS